ncbi:hypothetical protein EV191_104140 [Tamaricihabitans halophyticus]|uniref:Uncharacterized protein n=1 Tax=Tamaricihabitans halophyticus TaxID=1262583 RepID=A0A4R2QUC3_9PSEU|nr:hypothetical protein EV191_104140 [Tamaricihabitans halophyticus]
MYGRLRPKYGLRNTQPDFRNVAAGASVVAACRLACLERTGRLTTATSLTA